VNTTDTSIIRSEVPLATLDDEHTARLRAHALEAWREAELQVQAQWDAYVDADRGSARASFTAYLAALDAEAATAAALARTYLHPAAAV
jgi:hypothetical protein